jgi:hypothetical protein
MENHPPACKSGSMKGRQLERLATLPEMGFMSYKRLVKPLIKSPNVVLNILE